MIENLSNIRGPNRPRPGNCLGELLQWVRVRDVFCRMAALGIACGPHPASNVPSISHVHLWVMQLSPMLSVMALPFHCYFCPLDHRQCGAPGDGRGPSLRKYWNPFLVQGDGWKGEVSQSVGCVLLTVPQRILGGTRGNYVGWMQWGRGQDSTGHRESHSGR